MGLPFALADALIRRKVALHHTPLGSYDVRVARTTQERDDAARLVHAGYVYQGIESVRADELRADKQERTGSVVLVAYEGSDLVGTMSVIPDSNAGLPLDKDYPELLDALRKNGARLVEYGAYAIVERCWSEGVSNLLYIAANCLTSGKGASHVVIGVHPRAAAFYRAVFNFRVLADAKQHATLQAPVVGLVQDLAELKAFLRKSYRKPMASGRLPVEHFFGAPLPCMDLVYATPRPLHLVARDGKELVAC